MKVMVVDDDEVTLEVLRDRLWRAGYEVSLRRYALGTAAAVRQNQPDIVLLDVDMPGLRGDDLARVLDAHRRSSGGPAIILHASTPAAELGALANECGAVGGITKSSNEAEFFADLGRCLDRARQMGWKG